MAQFYNAEKNAFKPSTVAKAFKQVGVWPWDLVQVWKNYRENSREDSRDESEVTLNRVVNAMLKGSKECMELCRDLICRVKPVHMKKVPKTGKRRSREQHDAEDSDRDEPEGSTSKSRKRKSMSVQRPEKRSRKLPPSRGKCCVKGCQKKNFLSKKLMQCLKCKKNFCLSHVICSYHHKC